MTSGLTTTTFAYTGDGDRIAQATHGVTTTFTLDLNSALAQVLAAQGGGSQSLFLPGVGQQLNGDWLYYHGDALGAVRHVTGAAGNVLGTLRYSPFGERVESTGALPFLGFCEASFRARVSRSSPPAT